MSWKAEVTSRLGEFSLEISLEGAVGPLLIIGPNGSGKSSFLRYVAGALVPDFGVVQIGGHVVFDRAARLNIPPERRRVAYVPQGYGLFPHLDVLDNVAFGLINAYPRSTRRSIARAKLDQFGCGALAKQSVSRLSGGERQQVALARALTVEPNLLLLDEPLSALDVVSRRSTRNLLAHHLHEQKKPSIVVTHDVRDVLTLGGEIVVFEKGRVVQRGDAETLAHRPVNSFVEEFFGDT